MTLLHAFMDHILQEVQLCILFLYTRAVKCSKVTEQDWYMAPYLNWKCLQHTMYAGHFIVQYCQQCNIVITCFHLSFLLALYSTKWFALHYKIGMQEILVPIFHLMQCSWCVLALTDWFKWLCITPRLTYYKEMWFNAFSYTVWLSIAKF